MAERKFDKAKHQRWSKLVEHYIGGSSRYSSRPTVPDGFDFVQPTFRNCAHKILDSDKNTCLYLGPQQAVSKEAHEDLKKCSIGSIVNCTNTVPCYHRETIKYCQVPINDVEGADILTYLPGATTFLNAMLTKTNVLVHCQVGMSRSATVVIAYLMRFKGMSRDEAYMLCKKRRPLINPNPGFWEQLKKFEKWLSEKEEGKLKSSPHFDPKVDTKRRFDALWAQQASASYSTCIELPQHIIFTEDCWKIFVDQEKAIVANASHFLFVCLDFIWGRGVLLADLEWFGFICQRLENTRQMTSDFHNQTVSIFEQADDMVTIATSEFSEHWTGEVYEEHIKKYRREIDKAAKTLQKLKER